MEKLEKVIAGMEACNGVGDDCNSCPYVGEGEKCSGVLWAEALEVLRSREGVRPDWYSRLEELDYNYDPVKDGEPWYRAEDVWACIEEIPDDHREFGAHMDEEVADV